MKYIVFDIDGVLADCSHRLKYIQGKDKDYENFYSYDEVVKDIALASGFVLLKSIFYLIDDINTPNKSAMREEIRIALITGRNRRCEEATINWLTDNMKRFKIDRFQCNYFMRLENDLRPAYQVKEDLIKDHIGFKNILFAFDDDDKVNEMYKKHGVMCYKPNITSVV